MKVLLVIALLATCALSASLRTTKPTAELAKIAHIKQNGWGRALLSLGQLQMLTQGPLDDFYVALEDLLRDINA